jgi:Asp-tRNA(Asn)/Glu-tRNA(Gln) amidotransferase A subunit family amidase
VELAEMIRRRAVSCREVVTAALARLDAVNPRINAVVRPVQPGGGSVKGAAAEEA